MLKLRPPIAAVAAASIFASTAFAQATDEELTALVTAWVGDVGGYEGALQEYGVACLLPGVVAMPDTAKATLVTEGDMEAGLTVLQTADVATFEAFMPLVAECVDTLFLGEDILAWATDEGLGDVDAVVVCMMDAIRPLTTEAKQIIYLAEDFEAGARQLIQENPELAGDLDAQLEACD